MPGMNDLRLLGVAVAALRVDGELRSLDDEAFGPGFHAAECQGDLGWRWTDGAATIVLFGKAAVIEIEVAMVAPSWRLKRSGLAIAA